MNEFTSGFWEIYISVITLASIIACGILLVAQSRRRVAGGEAETTGHTWDEDLGEYNNPLPRWWMWLFWITIVFGLVYLALYPGLGSYAGLFKWTQTGQLAQETARHEQQFGPIYEGYEKTHLAALARDPGALAIGQKLFLNNCAQCHASDAGGSRGFPSLADIEWLWGDTPEAIKTSIAEGRLGVMPPWGPVLGEQGVKDAAHYVMSLSGMLADSSRVARGKALYAKTCIACHGPEAKGNPAMGAPDLTDNVWLHGRSEPQIMETIAKGRIDQMPAHKDILSPAKIHLLTAYVLSLSQNAK